MPDVLQSKASDWKYVSEGGATIVFSYQGPHHPDFDGTVLRLRKISVEAVVDVHESEEEELDDPTIEFQTKCMQRLIPPEHLPRLETVQLNRPWLMQLATLHDAIRPEARRAKDQVDLSKKKGVLATDLVGGKWLAVEIKPKWAFLPSSTHLSERTKATKGQTCRFCMHSHLRAKKGDQVVTEYCPLDLFSGNESRMRKAIRCLWDAWIASNGTANNLKIFASGKFVKPSDARIMLSDDAEQGIALNAIRDAFADALIRPLLQTPVLRILSGLQRKLDVLDIEGLSALWRETELATFEESGSDSVYTPTPLGGNSPVLKILDPDIAAWNRFLDDYLSSRHSSMDHGQPSAENLRHYVLAYLLSATFKDCSIIVRLDFLEPGGTSQQEIKPQGVTVIDLDPKRMVKIEGWEKLDREIVEAYALVREKVCVDEG